MVAGGLAGLADTWHVGRLQTVLHLGEAAAAIRLYSCLYKNPQPLRVQYSARRADCDWNARHVCALHVKDVFQGCSPLIIIGV